MMYPARGMVVMVKRNYQQGLGHSLPQNQMHEGKSGFKNDKGREFTIRLFPVMYNHKCSEYPAPM